MFNGSETGLFWNGMPTRTDISKEEQMAANDQVMMMLGGSANRD
jgi:hypothetical protein